MSDYFGALLRSTGAVPAAPLAPATATPTAGADLVEQDVERVSSASPEFTAAASSPHAPAGIEPAPRAEAAPASPDRAAMHSAPARGPLTRPGLDDEVHPAVRAALEWVAADPEPVDRTLLEVPERQAASDPSPRRQSPPLDRQPAPSASSTDVSAAPITQPEHTVRSGQATPTEHAISPSLERQAVAAPPSPARDLDLTPRLSRPRPQVVTNVDDAAPVPHEQIEVNIGTIHVRVDAPPAPRAVVQPAPPPQRPSQPARSAERSSFARSRVPRV